ncbi:MAG TPA: hypothetical protein VK645_07245 [Chitinophagaceae bacterium]|nr:hypothetical protein [Chitinophagaceae bacterium]
MRNKNQERKYYWLLVMLLAVGSCTNKKMKLAKLMADTKNGLVQVKKVNNNTVVMEVLPQNDLLQKNKNTGRDFYKVKLALRSNERIKNNAAMQYMNFDIKNSFYAVQGSDTLPCVICERIPGINDKEYWYMTFFNKPVIQNGEKATLRLYIADTIAGFGMMVFEIKGEVLKKLEAIK